MQFSYCRMTYRQFPFQHHLNQKLVKFEKKILEMEVSFSCLPLSKLRMELEEQ